MVEDSAEQGYGDEEDTAQVEIAFDEGVVEQGGQQQGEVAQGDRIAGVLGLFISLAVWQVLHFMGNHEQRVSSDGESEDGDGGGVCVDVEICEQGVGEGGEWKDQHEQLLNTFIGIN